MQIELASLMNEKNLKGQAGHDFDLLFLDLVWALI
jgi:hypothetical protein